MIIRLLWVARSIFGGRIHVKTLPAAACTFGVRIIEYELGLDLVVDVVHLHSDDEHQSLRINNYSHAPVLNYLVEPTYFSIILAVIHHIAIAVATASPDAHFYSVDALF